MTITANLHNVRPDLRASTAAAIEKVNARLPADQRIQTQREVIDSAPKATGTLAEQYVAALAAAGWVLDLGVPECIVPRNTKTNKAVHLMALSAGYRDWLAAQGNFPSPEVFKKVSADLSRAITEGLPHTPKLF